MVVYSAALTLFDNGEIKERDFIRRSGVVSLTPNGGRTVIRALSGVWTRRYGIRCSAIR